MSRMCYSILMPGVFNCPMCGAPLEVPGSGKMVRCPYCHNSVIVPAELRSAELRPETPAGRVPAPDPRRVFVTPGELAEIKQLLRDGQRIEAIKLYRQATTLGLKEAKDAVDAIEAADPKCKDRVAARQRKIKNSSIFIGLFFFAIASIFPIAFFPMGIQAWQSGEYVGGFFAFFGATVWAVIWGGIGWIILFGRH